MLEPDSRNLLLDALRPPVGCELDLAVGTTYSLDLVSLLAAPLAFAFLDRESGAGDVIADPIALLSSVRRFAERMTVFCQAGAIAVPRAYRGLFTYLEPSVVEVVPPNRDAIFHPKVWVIRYRDTATGDSRYRLLCASRNLTFDRSWDTILRLDGVQGTGHATSDRLARFVTRLGSLAVRPVPVDRQAALATLASEISTVDFELPGDVRQLAFWPLGLGGDTDPFQGPIQRMLVVSPFLTTGMAARFGRRGAPNILVSRPESFDLVGADALTGFGETLVLSEVATPSLDDPEFVTTTAESEVTTEAIAERPGIELRGLHAKLYVADVPYRARMWTGSANATDAAYNGNVEFLVEMEGKREAFGVDAFMGRAPTTGFRKTLTAYQPQTAAPQESSDAQRQEQQLDLQQRRLAGERFVAHVESAGPDTFAMSLVVAPDTSSASRWASLVSDTDVHMRPLTTGQVFRQQPTAAGDDMVVAFPGLSFERITSFFIVEMALGAGEQRQEVAFVINAELVGAPADRRERTLASLLVNQRDLIRFLLMLLSQAGSDDLSAAVDMTDLEPSSGSNVWRLAQWDSLLEPMVTALATNPSRLDDIERLMSDLGKSGESPGLLPGPLERGLGADLGSPPGVARVTHSAPLDPGPVLRQLKDFQLRTVDYAFQRMYVDEVPAKRFLVADEVGLGKTLVARGLIARVIEHLQSTNAVDRIDVIYICSNAEIARQNVNRLNVTDRQEFNLPTRITMLPAHLHQLKAHGINFVSFTPGTSFDLKSRSGMVAERALLYWLLRYAWGWQRRIRHAGVLKVLQGGAGVDSFRRSVEWALSDVGDGDRHIDRALADAFAAELRREETEAAEAGRASLRERFEHLADRLRAGKDDWHERQRIVGQLRQRLARSCVNALEPDLIILDEFQRFRHLLDGTDEAGELAQHLFDQSTARVLLLSATPYKMYTLPEEAEASEDHYVDFRRTTRFLMGTERAARFEGELERFRHAMLESPPDIRRLRKTRKQVEASLRSVMSRTERLAVSSDRNGMLVERLTDNVRLEAGDLRSYLAANAVGRTLGNSNVLEYWKSAPYLLNYMESYKLKRSFREALGDEDVHRELAGITQTGAGLLSFADIDAYKRVDPGNGRLRALMADTIDNETWRLLWMPPSLPYYAPEAPFDDPRARAITKRLVFSAWWMVPQVIATMLSYEAERRMMRSAGWRSQTTAASRARLRPPLRVQRLTRGTGQGIRGMSLFGLMYPSSSLARLADPLELARSLGGAAESPSLAAIQALAEARVTKAVAKLPQASDDGPGPVDERWYWAAPILLDAAQGTEGATAWIDRPETRNAWRRADDVASEDRDEAANLAWGEAIVHAREVRRLSSQLGRQPDDLVAVVARLAIAGPATVALRALSRVTGGLDMVDHPALRDGAARAAWGLRALFNVPEVTVMVRGKVSGDDDAYWRRVLEYAANGGIQSVLDEYAHILREWLGHLGRDPELLGPALGNAIHDAVTVRTANYRVEDVRSDGKQIDTDQRNIRARFALRFGSQSPDEGGDLQRSSQVRAAFNSPFWPFVLASTSVGQEGLDFHQYCHAIVHWNLPSNPVDLEQREGRVHRYKGHAIRKNVAAAQRAAAFADDVTDPWDRMFCEAEVGRDGESGDLVPYWIYPGEALIERHVPMLPLSREVAKLERLKKSLAVYRLVFGQPRQDDLAAWLSALPEDERALLSAELRIDLTPPRLPSTKHLEDGPTPPCSGR